MNRLVVSELVREEITNLYEEYIAAVRVRDWDKVARLCTPEFGGMFRRASNKLSMRFMFWIADKFGWLKKMTSEIKSIQLVDKGRAHVECLNQVGTKHRRYETTICVYLNGKWVIEGKLK